MDEISEMTDQHIQYSHDAENSSELSFTCLFFMHSTYFYSYFFFISGVETSLRKLVVSTNTSSENSINSAHRFSSDSTYSYGGIVLINVLFFIKFLNLS